MNLFKKVGALASASALAGVAVFAGAVGVANAAPVTLVIEPEYVAPGATFTVTIDGCAVGSTLSRAINGDVIDTEVVADGDLPQTQELDETFGFAGPGETVEFSVTCTPVSGSAEAASTASDSVTFFGATYVDAVPDTFHTGETVSITVGDFLPGTPVTLYVAPKGAETSVFEKPFGTAGADFSVTGDVVFPTDLECGEYLVEFADDKSGDVVTAELRICGAPEAPSPSPSADPSVTPSASTPPTATATASPSRPTNPGLPSTGN